VSQSKQCIAEGCEKPVSARGWCSIHYERWRRGASANASIRPYGTKGICLADGCEKPATHKSWCLLHYARWRKHGDPLIAQPRRAAAELEAFRAQTKQCARCAQDFSPTNSEAYPLHWAPYQVQAAWEQRQKMPKWAAWWEEQRRAEDLAEFAATVRGGPACRTNQAPRRRYFISGTCPDCNEMVTVVRHRWCGSIRCPPCTRARWRETHYERAARYGLRFDVIAPTRVFERDGWRCQICQRKTKGKWPAPRSPTVDHIVPMARGGHHVLENLQCACLACNVSKGARSANDQLRLAV
jgi:5-methylcytosine-specific restriction endonuclease McrA